MHLPNNTLLQGGKHKITRFIASGGFGCTYEAEHVLLGKRVAIKEFFVKDFCNRDEATSHVTVGTQSKVALVSKLKKKFIEEASALSRFNHPNIVHVSDVFEENGTAYYVMDYIDGRSIHEILKTQSIIPEAQAVKYITQIAEALKQVHAQNRLHLDIKPGNIIIDSQDNAILIDFGASKQYDEVDGENTSTLIGRTLGYAPLEQLGNDIVKFMPATDIYALGATLYKMLSGKTPLSATSLASGEDLEPLPNYITEGTKTAIDKSMAINKKLRPQTIAEFIGLLSKDKTIERQTNKVHKVNSPTIDDEETKIYDKTEDITYNVVLTSVGWRDQSVMNLLQELTRLGPYSSKSVIENVPIPILYNLSRKKAEDIKSRFEYLGAKIQLKENTLKENKVLSNAGLLFEIILEDIGWRNLTVPKLLMEFTGLKLEEVEKLISKTPCTILKSLGEEQAVNIKLKLEAKGAKVSLKQCQLKN